MCVPITQNMASVAEASTQGWGRAELLRIWGALAGAGFAFLFAHFAFGLGGPGVDNFVERWLYVGLELFAAFGCFLGAAWVPGSVRPGACSPSGCSRSPAATSSTTSRRCLGRRLQRLVRPARLARLLLPASLKPLHISPFPRAVQLF